MEGKLPVTIEVNNRPYTFTPENTVVRAARMEPVYNHVEIDSPERTERLFNFGSLCVYLSGMILPGEALNEESWYLTDSMVEEFGWNAPLDLQDYISDRAKERYWLMSTRDIKKEVVYLPKEWC